ncbi:alcohol dehydrogenase catalytic domain-containing protein [Leucobacter aridicollis]|uniref:S-(Hydroxymethyl)glutathione dehydrogenase/alcohol dehydrogenase n=1 Tax=Leucobacter aridicollis TaxID=283878 RepID=A0A852QWA6_9MICO|nr:alcohol dehydrogenase catalytic domain-containing protein [Leucobacter aridicollis]MBL3683391.1 alcohol dehydrogenase [Leucobacter aridicollis]NYD25631.1 S-(hydroxymethyl)glutathione dehydrogenase/alcohol dehydrogenase [Leucobacter aridicollis]
MAESLTVRSAVYHADSGDRLAVETLTLDPPGHGEVRIAVRAAGVCGSDRHVIDGEWNVPLPAVMGHEAAGVVEAIGQGVRELAVGDHVIIAWHQACQRCAECTGGKPWACMRVKSNDSQLPDGTTRWRTLDGAAAWPYLAVGAMSDHVVVPDFAAIKVDERVPFDIASLIGCSVGTGYGAVVNNAKVVAGEAAVVVGAGGVGLSIISALRLAGAHPIIAVDVTPEKLTEAARVGATHGLIGGPNLASEVAALTAGGADVAFEAIGRIQTMAQLPALIRPGGRAVFVGLPPEGQTLELDALQLAYDGKIIIGSNYGGLVPARDFPRVAAAYLAGELPLDELISSRVSLDEVNDAFDAMRRGERTRSVIVFPADPSAD